MGPPILRPSQADKQLEHRKRTAAKEREHPEIIDTYKTFRNFIATTGAVSALTTVTFLPNRYLQVPHLTWFFELTGTDPTPGTAGTFPKLHIGVNAWETNDDGHYVGAELAVVLTDYSSTGKAWWQVEGFTRW